MAKGKHAIASANRRLEAAHAHIDRLTSELADAKLRARDAERRAERLEGIEAMLDRADVRRDDLIVLLTQKCEWWAKVAKEDWARRHAALGEVMRIAKDQGLVQLGGQDLPFNDAWDFLHARYPAIMSALTAGGGHVDHVTPGTSFRNLEERLQSTNVDSLKAFQRLVGERAELREHKGKDVGKVLAEILEADQIGFTPSETLELVLGEPGPTPPEDQ